jgi:hypothetical protein
VSYSAAYPGIIRYHDVKSGLGIVEENGPGVEVYGLGALLVSMVIRQLAENELS